MIIENGFEQGSDQWHKARVGNPGASSFDKIITSTGKPSTQRKKYLYQMAGEIITGQPAVSFQTDFMTRGIEMESEARQLFEMLKYPVEQCAMVYPDHTKDYHCSPDGILPDQKSGLEIKCPSLPVAVEYLDKADLPTAYKIQVQGSLMVTGYEHWYFMSYYPGLKPLIIQVERDEKLISIIREEVEEFIKNLKDLVDRLQ